MNEVTYFTIKIVPLSDDTILAMADKAVFDELKRYHPWLEEFTPAFIAKGCSNPTD